MEEPKITLRAPKDVTILAALEELKHEAEESMKLIQEDGKISPKDKTAILKSIRTIEHRIEDVKELLKTSGTYSSERLDGDADP